MRSKLIKDVEPASHPNAEFFSGVTGESAFNLDEMNDIDLEILGIKAVWQSHDKPPYKNGYLDLLHLIYLV